METLKEFEKITEPDDRQEYFAIFKSLNELPRPITIEDIYAKANSIKLHQGVPEGIRSHFSVAKNLLVYSWFYYPFNVTAQFLAFVTVELALKERYRPKKRKSFRLLVKRAVSEGLVKDSGFSHVRSVSESSLPHKKTISVGEESVSSYVEVLVDVMPDLRNELAHGSKFLDGNGASSVTVCAEFINQLFADTSS